MPVTRLTDHFSLEELVFSETAARRGLDNTPSPAVVANLRRVAALMEQVRACLGGHPVVVSSGYRSPAVNQAVGGAANSAHMQGLAIDFTVPACGSPQDVAEALAHSGLVFDQLIHEFGSWVHLGLAPLGQTPRRQLLTCRRRQGRTETVAGIQSATALA